MTNIQDPVPLLLELTLHTLTLLPTPALPEGDPSGLRDARQIRWSVCPIMQNGIR